MQDDCDCTKGHAPAGVRSLLLRHAGAAPDSPAIMAPGTPALSYAGLVRQIDSAAASLNAAGVVPGDRVAVVLPNGPEMATCFLAVATTAACAPLNPAYRAPEFEFYLEDLRAKALIVQTGLDSPARAVAADRAIPILELTPCQDQGAGSFRLDGDTSANPAKSGPVTCGRRDDTALVLHTSGTTGRPKMVALSHANLCASARNIASWLALTPADRCLNVMPLFHIHGLIGATLSTLTGGGSLVCSRGFLAPSFFEWLEAFRPTWYTAVPTIHQAVLACAAHLDEKPPARSLRFIRSSSASLPPQVMAGLEDLFGVPVLEAYGMTEASHQMACNPLPPRRRKPGSVGLPAGPRVAVMDAEGRLLGPGAVGEIVIRGENVTAGYVANDEANAKSFTAGWFRTGDQGLLDADGYLFIHARTKEIINRGGEKISPREIEEVLLDHPAVAEAIAFALPDPRLGEEVAAAVVLRPGAAADQRSLRSFAAERLADFKLPRRIVFLDQMPKGATGKPQRIGMAERLGLPGADADETPDEPLVPASTTTELLLARLWAKALKRGRIGIRENFFEAGGDSLTAIDIVLEAGRIAGVSLSAADLYEAPTIEAMAALIDGGHTKRRVQRLFAIQPNGKLQPFFCIGAGPLMRELALQVGTDRPYLSPLCYDFSELPHPCRIEDIATFHVETIRATQPAGPYLLGGWCVDGIVAWEVARHLRARGEPVELLVLFDAVNETTAAAGRRHTLLRRAGEEAREFIGLRPGAIPAHALGRLRAIGERMRRRAVQLDYDLRLKMRMRVDRVVSDALAIQHRAVANYRPGPLDVPILLLRSARRLSGTAAPPDGGWSALATRGLHVEAISGDHRDMFLPPHVASTAQHLRRRLDAVPQ